MSASLTHQPKTLIISTNGTTITIDISILKRLFENKDAKINHFISNSCSNVKNNYVVHNRCKRTNQKKLFADKTIVSQSLSLSLELTLKQS